jgi:hypothetical protein
MNSGEKLDAGQGGNIECIPFSEILAEKSNGKN